LRTPCHLTILYPFLPPDRLDRSVRVELARIAAAHEPFEVELTAVRRWPTVVHLAAEPADRLIALTRAVERAWPDFPPYGGVHAELVPHLTLAETDDLTVLDAVAIAADALWLPIRSRAGSMDVLTEDEDGMWRLRWRVPLGSPTDGT
jgi:2'-5' RNA ligase